MDQEGLSREALDLADAEARGFRAALQAMRDGIDGFLSKSDGDAYVRTVIEAFLEEVQVDRDSLPTPDWRPMRSCPPWNDLEYLFPDGAISRHVRRFVVLPDVATVPEFGADLLRALAWRFKAPA